MTIQVLYFASLREAAGKSSEQLPLPSSLMNLYVQLRTQYMFCFEPNALRVAVNGQFSSWHALLQEGDIVAFIPPVSGG
jgi:molybdopterin synthase sulfur carrier subunit